MITQDEIKELLKKNDYFLDPLYNYYCKKKTMIGYVFTLDKEFIYIKRAKWGGININESPIKISYRNFEPYVYGLADNGKRANLIALAKAEDKARLARFKNKAKSSVSQGNNIEFSAET